ncbi:hypothetical protein [Fluviicola sp.]|uniref:hypothetical protein n=1 Tax=Fluviicola sp. TaxID=1917219 RepID=UPI003D2E9521
MRIGITILIIFCSFGTFSQRNSRDISSVDLIYGFRTLNRPMFGSIVEKRYSTFSDFQWSSPLQFVGAGITLLGDSIDTGGKYFIGNAQIVAYLPQRINITDSLTAKSGGFNFGLTFLGIDAFPKTKNFDLVFNFGFDVGRILLTNPGFQQRNLYFAPKVSIQPKVKMGLLHFLLLQNMGMTSLRTNGVKRGLGRVIRTI